MRKTLLIARREYLAAVRTKSFVIGILLMPILMSGGFIAQTLLKDQVDVRPKHFAVLDRSPGGQMYAVLDQMAKLRNKKAESAETGKPTKAPFVLEEVKLADGSTLEELRLALSDRVRDGGLTGFLEIGPDVLKPPPLSALVGVARALVEPGEVKSAKDAELSKELEPHALRYQTNRPSYTDFVKWAEVTLSATVLAKRAQARNLAATDLTNVVTPVPVVTKGLASRDPASGEIREGEDQSPVVAFLLPGGLVVLMFMVILLGAAPMMQGVIEEKMQRIAEVLLGSVRPFELMMGKLIGMAGVSLTMASVYLGGAYWAAHRYGYAEYLSGEVIAWFVVFQVLAVFMFGSIYAAVGAACSDMKEAQSMLTPVTLITMLPLFVWVNVVREPTSAFATAASFFPPATPMLMTARLAIPPGVPLWQPLVGIGVVLAATVVCVYAAGRVFRVGLLLQGKGARFGEMLRWVVKG